MLMIKMDFCFNNHKERDNEDILCELIRSFAKTILLHPGRNVWRWVGGMVPLREWLLREDAPAFPLHVQPPDFVAPNLMQPQ
jgi:hypothetical protein